MRAVAAALAAALSAAPAPAIGVVTSDAVVRVLEGDRVKLAKGGVVALAGVATPTAGVPDCYDRAPFSRTAALLPRGAPVYVEAVAGGVELRLARDGTSLNARLVRSGAAKSRRRKADDALAAALADAEAAARRDGLGIWRTCDGDGGRYVAAFDDVDRPPPEKAAVTAVPRRGCAAYDDFEAALDAYERGSADVKRRLDQNGDFLPCPGLPHAANRARFRFKRPRPP